MPRVSKIHVQLFLDPELKRMLDALSQYQHAGASDVLRQLILKEYRELVQCRQIKEAK